MTPMQTAASAGTAAETRKTKEKKKGRKQNNSKYRLFSSDQKHNAFRYLQKDPWTHSKFSVSLKLIKSLLQSQYIFCELKFIRQPFGTHFLATNEM